MTYVPTGASAASIALTQVSNLAWSILTNDSGVRSNSWKPST